MIIRKCVKGPYNVLLNVCNLLKVFDSELDYFKFPCEANIDCWYFILEYDSNRDIPCYFFDAMLKMYGHLELEIL